MNKKTLHDMLAVHPVGRSRFAARHPELLEQLDQLYPGVDLKVQIGCHAIGKSPYCVVCGNALKMTKNDTCSLACRDTLQGNPEIQSIRVANNKATMIERYGVPNPANMAGMTSRRQASMMKKYGALVTPKSLASIQARAGNLNTKGRETMMSRYGVANPSQISGHSEKYKNTLMEKHGVTHWAHTEASIASRKDRRFAKWSKLDPTVTVIDVVSPSPEVLSVSPTACRRVLYTCLACGSHGDSPTETFKWRVKMTGTSCAECGGLKIGSVKQLELSSFIRSLGHCVTDNHRMGSGRQIDAYLADLNIGFEFNGLYWHSEVNGTASDYHIGKTDEADRSGISLFQVFEDEWDHKRDIVKSEITGILENFQDAILSDRYDITEIGIDVLDAFLNENHVSGACAANVACGLYHGGVLQMVLSAIRKSENEYQITRICSRLNTRVERGLDDMFDYFVQITGATEITASTDRRWNHGMTFKSLGFTIVGRIEPDYWYANLKSGTRTHHDIITSDSVTSVHGSGPVKIWDCGQTMWRWNKK